VPFSFPVKDGKAMDPKDFGGEEVYPLQCPDPESKAIFEITRERIGERIEGANP
jgi:hypothetical protein